MDTYGKWYGVAGHYALGMLSGVSEGLVSKILKKYNLLTEEEEEKQKREEKSWAWLKKDMCWTIDTVEIKYRGRKVYLIIVDEEYSRKPLGYCLSLDKSGKTVKVFLEGLFTSLGKKPLIIKYDRGKEFNNKEVTKYLKSEGVIILASPRYYPRFNGKHERSNLIIRVFLKNRLKGRYSVEVLDEVIRLAMDWAANILPRRMFGGRTSKEVYDAGESYTEEDRRNLLEKIEEKRLKVDGEKEASRRDFLDWERKHVVESVVELNLCEVKSKGENANQLSA